MKRMMKVTLSAVLVTGVLFAFSSSSSYAAAPPSPEPETLQCKHSGTCCGTSCQGCCSGQCQTVTNGCGSTGTRCQGG